MTNLKALALTALCVAWPLALPCGPRGRACAEPARPERYDHFVHGVYITPSESVLTVPLTKVFTDFLTHGIEIAIVGRDNYFPLAKEQGLNAVAKANGVRLYTNLYLPAPTYEPRTDEELRAVAKASIDAANALPDADALAGWYTADEIPFRWSNASGWSVYSSSLG